MPIIILARLPTIKFMDSDFAEAIHFKVTCITKRSYNIDNVSTVCHFLGRIVASQLCAIFPHFY